MKKVTRFLSKKPFSKQCKPMKGKTNGVYIILNIFSFFKSNREDEW